MHASPRTAYLLPVVEEVSGARRVDLCEAHLALLALRRVHGLDRGDLVDEPLAPLRDDLGRDDAAADVHGRVAHHVAHEAARAGRPGVAAAGHGCGAASRPSTQAAAPLAPRQPHSKK